MLLDAELSSSKAPNGCHRLGLLCAIVLGLATLLWAKPASAYAWMLRHSYTGCGVCHADPSGGELLTLYGRMQGNLLLRMQYGKTAGGEESGAGFEDEGFDDSDFDDFGSFDESEGASGDDAESADDTGDEEGSDSDDKGKNADAKDAGAGEPSVGFLWGLFDTPPGVLLGGGFRNLMVYQLESDDPFKFIPIMMGDLYFQVKAQSVRVAATAGITKVAPGSPHGHAAQVTRAQGDELNMVSRTHWLGFDMGENDEYLLRFGRINLPFGVRIPEHTMWVREATRTDRESDQQHGVSLEYTGDKFRTEIMAIAGNYQINPDIYRERGYSMFFEYFVDTGLALGVSSLVTHVQADRLLLANNVTRQAHGVMGRAALTDWLVLLAEADALLTTDTSTGYVGFAQFDIEAVQGLHFMLTGEFLNQGLRGPESDTNQPAPGAGEARFGGWASIDWFFYKQFEFRIDAVQRQGSDTQLLGQLHFYL